MVVTPVIWLVVMTFEVLFVGLIFTPHNELLLLGTKTYMIADNPNVLPAPTVTEGFPDQVPLNVHQNMAIV